MESTDNLKNIIQSAANLEDIGENAYAAACIDPRLDARYPDDASGLSFLKKVHVANEYKIEDLPGFTNDLRFVVR